MALTNGASAEEPAPNVPDALLERFKRLDRNADQQLSVEEFQASVGAAQLKVAMRDFGMVDRDTNSRLTLAESWALPSQPTGQRGPMFNPMNDVNPGMVQIWVAVDVSGKVLAAGSTKGPAASALDRKSVV